MTKAEIEQMFADMGLARPEDRQRFAALSGKPDATGERDQQEQTFIRIVHNTEPAEEENG
jgi:hypothetical protein